ncbi:MAG: tetratricopeptide repeat protein [Muribaculaceae bacterium]|nr:tetratricopeptide repeat protein [Muribaculaceae bacterium]
MKHWLTIIILLLCCSNINAQINTEQVMRSGKNALAYNDYMLSIQYFNLAIQSEPNQALPYLYRAIAKFNLEDFVGAEIDATEAIKRNPFIRDVFEVRGAARQLMRNYDGALDDYQKALDALPQNRHILYNMAIVYKENGDEAKSEKILKQLVQDPPDNYRAYRGLAILKLSDKDSIGALEYLDSTIRLNQTNYVDYMLRSYIEKDCDKALLDINEAIKLSPYSSMCYVVRAQLYYKMNNTQKALDDYSTAISINPNENISQYNRAVILYEMGVLSKNEYDKEALLLAGNGVININKEPGLIHVEPRLNEQLVYNCPFLRHNENKIVKIKPEPLFAVSYYTTDVDAQFSPKIINEISEINSSRLLRYDLIITNHEPTESDSINLDDHLAAIDYYNYHISSPTPTVMDYFGRSIDYYILRDYASSVDDLNKTIEMAPDFMLGYFMRAVARTKKILAEEKQNIIEREKDAFPQIVQIEYVEVIEDWDKVISMQPRLAIAYYNKGYVLFAMGKYKEAISEFDKALTLDPLMGEAYYNRGFAYMNIGEEDEAKEDISKAGELGVASAYNLMKLILRN